MNRAVRIGPGSRGPTEEERLSATLVERLGGRFSAGLGIDVDAGDVQVERWFLAAALFGNRIASSVAERTYLVLAEAGVATVADVPGRSWEDLVGLLDAGGYVRYDFRTATRLGELASTLADRYGGDICRLRSVTDSAALEAELDRLPGWGPVTVRLFLRELRGVWPGAAPPLDQRAVWALHHVGLGRAVSAGSIERLGRLAGGAGVDVRDLEAALVRLVLAHPRSGECPGGEACVVLTGRLR